MKTRFSQCRTALAGGLLALGTSYSLFPAALAADNPAEPILLPASAGETGIAKPAIAKRESFPRAFRKDLPESVSDLKNMETHVEHLLARVSSAVVAVEIGDSSGSAVIVSPEGVALTAAHVCGRPGISVEFRFPDGRKARGVTLGTNHAVDAGLMKITDPGPWPFVPVGELGAARMGDWVMALGHPGGFDAERPVVLRLGRIITLIPEVMQTDCTLIMGDSGGPLFDMHGRVVAIHSRISESAEDNFHVPITAYLDAWERLAKSENWGSSRPPRATSFGATGEDHADGCKILTVAESGRAARFGFKADDIVLKMDGQKVASWDEFRAALSRLAPGAEVSVLVRREGEEVTIQYRASRAGRGRGTP